MEFSIRADKHFPPEHLNTTYVLFISLFVRVYPKYILVGSLFGVCRCVRYMEAEVHLLRIIASRDGCHVLLAAKYVKRGLMSWYL